MAQKKTERIELLQTIFDTSNNWLHFAEAKNAALIAFNVALIAAIMGTDLSDTYLLLTGIIIIGLIISTIVSIWSFKPINRKLNKITRQELTENLLHFAYIASLEKEEYLQKLYFSYWNETNKNINDLPQLEIDYCEEIIQISRITMKKQNCFKFGFYIVLLILIILGVWFIYAQTSQLEQPSYLCGFLDNMK